VQAELTEAVFLPVAETAGGSIAPDAVDAVIDAASRAHAVAIGPGLSRDPGTASFVREVVRTSPVPLVVDADALQRLRLGRRIDSRPQGRGGDHAPRR
jgi:NAD(P)H-hydrate repair Nnr-like enzyme with NAD(P)H-hydrate dehydratase domain